MTRSSRVFAAFRLVRLSALTFAFSLLVGFIAVQSFTAQYGTPASTVVLDANHSDSVLAAAVRQQEATGLVCSERPALTDVVLFQRDHGEPVKVLTFDAAVRASADRSGWIRRYCV